MMTTSIHSKSAVDFLKHFKLSPYDFPSLVLLCQRKTIYYYIEKPFRKPEDKEYMKFEQILQIFEGKSSLEVFLVQELIIKYNRNKVKKMYLDGAVEACRYYGNIHLLMENEANLIRKYISAEENLGGGGNKDNDVFGPITKNAFTMKCQFEEVMFVNDLNSLKIAEEQLLNEKTVYI